MKLPKCIRSLASEAVSETAWVIAAGLAALGFVVTLIVGQIIY